MKMSKLAIIGLGHVGSAVLTQAMAMNLAAEIVCIDINEKVAHGEALDATHATPCTYVPGTFSLTYSSKLLSRLSPPNMS